MNTLTIKITRKLALELTHTEGHHETESTDSIVAAVARAINAATYKASYAFITLTSMAQVEYLVSTDTGAFKNLLGHVSSSLANYIRRRAAEIREEAMEVFTAEVEEVEEVEQIKPVTKKQKNVIKKAILAFARNMYPEVVLRRTKTNQHEFRFEINERHFQKGTYYLSFYNIDDLTSNKLTQAIEAAFPIQLDAQRNITFLAPLESE